MSIIHNTYTAYQLYKSLSLSNIRLLDDVLANSIESQYAKEKEIMEKKYRLDYDNDNNPIMCFDKNTGKIKKINKESDVINYKRTSYSIKSLQKKIKNSANYLLVAPGIVGKVVNGKPIFKRIDKDQLLLHTQRYLKVGKDYLHRIVAFQKVPNDDSIHKTYVDHINHDKHDNIPSNLRWVTPEENAKNRTPNRR